MSRFDIVIFGATGFTGKKAVEHIVTLAKKYGNLTWAVAGRSQSKLETVLADVSAKTGEDLSSTKIIIADITNEESLLQMCSMARVIANCCGPYRLYGEPVVKAAIQGKTHYVDVSGEPQFIETMVLKYDKAAKEAGVYIISACGFDSIPNDLGVQYLEDHFGGTVNSIESYLYGDIDPECEWDAKRNGAIHYGTWESLVYSLAHMGELKYLRKKMFPEPLPALKPRIRQRGWFHSTKDGYNLKFPGADSSIVYRSQRYLFETEQKRPIQFRPFVKFTNLFYALVTLIGGAVLFGLSQFKITRGLLLDHPRLFSLGAVTRKGPSEAVMQKTKFYFDLYGEGWNNGTDLNKRPDKKVLVRVSGYNPGYGATVVGLVMSAVTILKEQDKMPHDGGVLTTTMAFRKTNIIKHLIDNKFNFEVVNE